MEGSPCHHPVISVNHWSQLTHCDTPCTFYATMFAHKIGDIVLALSFPFTSSF